MEHRQGEVTDNNDALTYRRHGAERTNNDEEHSNKHLLHSRFSGNLLAVRLENEGCSVDAAVLAGACG